MSRYIGYGLVSFALVLALSCCLKVSVASEAEKHYDAGLEQYKKGWYDQAIREFEKAIDLKRGYVSAHYALGNSYYCKHLYDKAVKEYHKVLRYNPDHVKAHYALWLCYRALGMTGDADRELEIYKRLSGKKGEEEKASTTTSYSAKGDSARSGERTTSWHVAESQTPAETETHSKSSSHAETKETKPHETQQDHPKETAKKPAETLAHSEQKQEEPTHTTPAAHTEHQEPPAEAKEKTVESHKPAEAHVAESHKPASDQAAHSPSQPEAHKQPSANVTAELKVEEKPTSLTAPTHAKAEEQVQASPSHPPVHAETTKVAAHTEDHSSTDPVKEKKSRIAVKRPLGLVGEHGIKARLEHLWNNAPMGKFIVGIVLYIFAAQVWIGIVAMLGLFFCRKR